MAQDAGLIQGQVTDPSGEPVYGAVVVVEGADASRHTTVTDVGGGFQISSLAPGAYSVKISGNGFSDWTAWDVLASTTPDSKPLAAVLQLAMEVTSVTVGLEPEEVAAEQVHQELKQRALGVIPNYFVTYDNHPAPLSPAQKFHLSFKMILDPTSFATAGIIAGIQQKMNSYYEWGQGSEGFAKRFGAAYLTGAQNLLITSVVADSILHQDPRYFYSGEGTKTQRAWYAIKSAFRAKGDNGKWEPPYAGLIGLVGSAEFSEIYYPGSRTQYTLLGRGLMFHFAGLVALNLGEEFLLKHVTSHTRELRSTNAMVLREGSRVALIAVDGFGKEGVKTGEPVTFVLAKDLTVGEQVVAKTGDVASGQVGEVKPATLPGEAVSVRLERVTLRAGSVNVPLRSSQVRGTDGPIQYRQLPESGKVEVTLFVAENMQFPADQ
jgi:hypothetical protein